jgi:23S rRNA maturation-related 3'-5' exoribonuclease YhaM
MKAADFVGHLFLARDVTHSVHLNTRSYAKHKALNKFYDGIVDLADSFAEAYQGRHGLIGPISLQSAKKTGNVIEFLTDSLAEIEANRYKVCEEKDSAIQNIIDEVVGLYLSTLYKLKFLA